MNGWKLVPVNPTLEMLTEGDQCLTCSAKDVWGAMIDLAPEVEPLGVRHQYRDGENWRDCIGNDLEFHKVLDNETRTLYIYVQP